LLHIHPETLEGALALAAAPGGQDDPFLRTALEAARIGTWRIDMATRLSSWDAVTSAVFGLEQAPRVNAEPLLHIHAEDRPWVAHSLEDCFARGTPHDVEFRADNEGEPRWIRAIARRVCEADGVPRWVCGTVMDVTERKAAENAIREGERRLSTLMGNLPGIAYRCGTEAPWHLDFVSDSVEAITGWSAAEWMAHRVAWGDIVHRKDGPALLEEVERGVAQGTRFSATYRIVRRDGALRWVHETGVPVCDAEGRTIALEGYIADITEQKLLEAALRASTDSAHHILDSLPQIIWCCDGDGKTTYLSRQWDEFTGIAGAAARLEHAGAVHPDDVPMVRAIWRERLPAGEPLDYQFRLRHASGEYRWMLAQAVPERDADGKVVRWFGTSTDIHERVMAEQARDESEAITRSILLSSADSIKMLDLEGRILFANRLGTSATGVDDPAAALGLRWVDRLRPENRAAAKRALARARKGETAQLAISETGEDGETHWWDVVATPVRDDAGTVSRLVVVSRDITHQKQSEERVRWIANHDSLTALPNRLLFQERLDQMACPDEGVSHFALLLLDIDDFKRVNDTLGHDAGDALLCAFAERLKEAARKDDLVARLGGDEFAVILNGVDSEEEVTSAVEGVMAALRRPWHHGGMILDCDASIGASLFPKDGASRAELMKHADIALYVAKASGRGNLKLFQAAMRAEMQNRISMLSLARDAIDKDWIIPFYQPKVDLRTGKVAGFEALLRWRHPGKGIQSPDTIAAAFEDLTIAAALSDRMVEKVIDDVRRWRETGVNFRHVAINASAAEFRCGDFAERLLERLHSAGVPPSSLQLEVTETVFLGRGAECVERTLKLLSQAGVTIALDDFGTGYASLSHLKQFPVDLLKIDRSFVRDLGQQPDAAAIIRAVINLGHSLEIEIVAEGIETAAQEARLLAQGCDYGQGYLYSPAVPAGEVPTLLARYAVPQPLPRAG
jgi:diguanylate cyclase (GGDEF)-like protein/PAS domain S-box-containing protein